MQLMVLRNVYSDFETYDENYYFKNIFDTKKKLSNVLTINKKVDFLLNTIQKL